MFERSPTQKSNLSPIIRSAVVQSPTSLLKTVQSPPNTKTTLNVNESSNSPNVDRFTSPANSPVYSPAIVSSPLTVDREPSKSVRSLSESSSTSVITPTRTPTPVLKSPLSQTLSVVRSPRQDSPSFPTSPPRLVDEVRPSIHVKRPTAIVANTNLETKLDGTTAQSNYSTIKKDDEKPGS